MNKVVTINLGGTAYQLEEGGYDALRAYLENAGARLQGNPDREEILSDIEWAIAEKFRALLNRNKNVVATREVAAVLAEMGPVEADPGKAPDPAASGPGGSGGANTAGGASGGGAPKAGPTPTAGGTARRLYRIREGEEIAGVCNGIAAYVGIDPTIIRLAFVFLTIAFGSGVLVYIILAIVVPEAVTPEEKAAATGDPATAEEFIRRAKAGYYEAIRGFPDRQARREWKRRFKREMRASAGYWRWQWHRHWTPPPFHPALGASLPVISLAHGALSLLWIAALISLLSTGTLFGRDLPLGLPVWLAALVLCFLYGVVAGPLKVARRMCYWSSADPRPWWSVVFLLDSLVWLAVTVSLIWLALHYLPELRTAIQHLPVLAHQAVEDIRNWWHQK